MSRRFACTNCALDFSRKSNLRRHEKQVHEDERRFACKVAGCFRAYKRNKDLKKHELLHAEATTTTAATATTASANTSNVTTVFACTAPRCTSSFATRELFVAHVSRIHATHSTIRSSRSTTTVSECWCGAAVEIALPCFIQGYFASRRHPMRKPAQRRVVARGWRSCLRHACSRRKKERDAAS